MLRTNRFRRTLFGFFPARAWSWRSFSTFFSSARIAISAACVSANEDDVDGRRGRLTGAAGSCRLTRAGSGSAGSGSAGLCSTGFGRSTVTDARDVILSMTDSSTRIAGLKMASFGGKNTSSSSVKYSCPSTFSHLFRHSARTAGGVPSTLTGVFPLFPITSAAAPREIEISVAAPPHSTVTVPLTLSSRIATVVLGTWPGMAT